VDTFDFPTQNRNVLYSTVRAVEVLNFWLVVRITELEVTSLWEAGLQVFDKHIRSRERG
jgi:hypothetical protein